MTSSRRSVASSRREASWCDRRARRRADDAWPRSPITAGVVLGLFELGSAQPSVVREPGALIWGELITDDVEASAAFYRAVFGWQLSSPEGPLNRRVWLVGGQRIAGLLPRPEAMARRGARLLGHVVRLCGSGWRRAARPGPWRHPADGSGRHRARPHQRAHRPSGAVFSISAPRTPRPDPPHECEWKGRNRHRSRFRTG